jgi:ubiquinone/menaquinone biosynthesis C-methylase UbiE
MHCIKGIELMSEYRFTQVDFDHPSFMFVLEDWLKGLLGCALFYNPYIKTFGLKGGEKVLDFGCGGGIGSRCLLKFLNDKGHLACIDTSKYWIKKAEKRLSKYSNVSCSFGEINNLSVPDYTFDVITIMHVIHDIAPGKRQDIVNTLSRKLKIDGCLFIREPIKISHGISINELKTLMKNAHFWELDHKQNKSEYSGKYLKTTPSHTIIENKKKYYYPLRD